MDWGVAMVYKCSILFATTFAAEVFDRDASKIMNDDELTSYSLTRASDLQINERLAPRLRDIETTCPERFVALQRLAGLPRK